MLFVPEFTPTTVCLHSASKLAHFVFAQPVFIIFGTVKHAKGSGIHIVMKVIPPYVICVTAVHVKT